VLDDAVGVDPIHRLVREVEVMDVVLLAVDALVRTSEVGGRQPGQVVLGRSDSTLFVIPAA
jgi:hypothetical protein